jgi:hypothetical protein
MMFDTRFDSETSAELEKLELMLMDPAVRRNRQQVSNLLADSFVEFGASGRIWTKRSMLDFIVEETYTPPQVHDFACRMLAENIALTTYRTLRIGSSDQCTCTLRSSIWKKEAGKWKLYFHQGTQTSR